MSKDLEVDVSKKKQENERTFAKWDHLKTAYQIGAHSILSWNSCGSTKDECQASDPSYEQKFRQMHNWSCQAERYSDFLYN